MEVLFNKQLPYHEILSISLLFVLRKKDDCGSENQHRSVLAYWMTLIRSVLFLKYSFRCTNVALAFLLRDLLAKKKIGEDHYI